MARSAKPRKLKTAPVRAGRGGFRSLAGFVARNPAAVGGTTAFLVAMAYVSANALWYQPHAHAGAFFVTRVRDPGPSHSLGEDEQTTIRIERPLRQAVATPDEPTRQAQGMLKDLQFYDGVVDGILGPNTLKAVGAYRETVGLPASGEVDAALLQRLARSLETGSVPATPGPPPPAERLATIEDLLAQPEPSASTDPRIAQIQKGLKAFGNEAIEVDGVMGQRTRAALREFQALFGLPETGEPDAQVQAKMKEIGLTN